MQILIITGGNSSERTISFLSARQVQNALLKNDYLVTVYDLKNGYTKLRALASKFDLLFPVLHGEEGEGGKLHKFLANLNKPIVGSKNYQGFKKAWYKISFKKYCDKNKILTPKWKITKTYQQVLTFGFPCVLKTSSGGSSREVFILKSERDLNKHKNIFSKYQDLFSEKYIEGTEVTVGILNNIALPILEIIPPKNDWFNYKNKYSGETQELLNAPSLDDDLKNKIQENAVRIHKHFELGSYSRIDFIIQNRHIFVLELNTIPGLTQNSLLPKETGMSFPRFIDTLVKLALKS